ncbi:hypothetical protein HC928_00570 [bacterium]|nr:hypothetical protein [bacterium]
MNKFHVVIGTPTAGAINAFCHASIVSLVIEICTRKVFVEVDEQYISHKGFLGSGIMMNREHIVDHTLKVGATHLLFIDDDVSFDPRAFFILAHRRQPVVVTNYRLKMPGGRFMAVDLKTGGIINTTEDATGLEPCDFAGFGLSLISAEVLAKMKKPRFLPQWVEDQQMYTTEDNPFFNQVRSLGYTVWVDHDASKLVKHHGSYPYSYKDDATKPMENVNELLA